MEIVTCEMFIYKVYKTKGHYAVESKSGTEKKENYIISFV